MRPNWLQRRVSFPRRNNRRVNRTGLLKRGEAGRRELVQVDLVFVVPTPTLLAWESIFVQRLANDDGIKSVLLHRIETHEVFESGNSARRRQVRPIERRVHPLKRVEILARKHAFLRHIGINDSFTS